MGRDFGSETDGKADLRLEFVGGMAGTLVAVQVTPVDPYQTPRLFIFPLIINRFLSVFHRTHPGSALSLKFSTDDSDKTLRDFIFR
jgi:hypothetical protein